MAVPFVSISERHVRIYGRSNHLNTAYNSHAPVRLFGQAHFVCSKIGAKGSGKSTILEAIGLLSAARRERVDSASLQRKGIRLSSPLLYKSYFKSIPKWGRSQASQQPANTYIGSTMVEVFAGII